VAFRKIFGDENKKEILISFLNNILEFAGSDKEIMDITIQNPYQVPKLKDLKETILDIKAVDKRNIHYIIEMQVFHTTAFEKKVLYYVGKSYYQQSHRAEDYPKLNQVIFLGFLNFKLFQGVAPPTYYCIGSGKEHREEKVYQESKVSEGINKENPDYAREEGKEEGIRIGEEKGKEEGIKIGEEKGIKKGKIETAKELLKMGIEIEKIAEATGLKKEEIEKLTQAG
jgi:hypothetical protein